MIVFCCTWTHRYTHRAVQADVPGLRIMSYPELFARRRLPRATYVFSDFDRLGPWQLEVAALTYRALDREGCRVLNDPARVLNRLALLRRLEAEGVNSFRAWPAWDEGAVDRWPVFLRTVAAHRGTLSPPLADRPALQAALARLLAEGYPIMDLAIIEFRAEPLHGDVYRKSSMYCVGGVLTPTPSVHERNWTAKAGEGGVAGDEGYASDLEMVRTMPHAAVLRRAFEVAGVAYGRADFAVVGGRAEVYEINTNPMMRRMGAVPYPARAEAGRLSHAAYLGAFRAMDDTRGGTVPVPRPARFGARSRWLKLLPGYQWMP